MGPVSDGESGETELRAALERYLADEFRPFFQQDGGDYQVVGVTRDADGTALLQLELLGAYANCGSAARSIGLGIETAARERFPGLRVQAR